jgi:hypothetical protein
LAREYICNKCGKRMNEYDIQERLSVYQNLGYGSKFDGERVEIDLCCDCFDTIIEECKISPIIHTQYKLNEARDCG